MPSTVKNTLISEQQNPQLKFIAIISLLISLTACQTAPSNTNTQQPTNLPTPTIHTKTTNKPTTAPINPKKNVPILKQPTTSGKNQKTVSNPFSKPKTTNDALIDNPQHIDNIANAEDIQNPPDTNEDTLQQDNHDISDGTTANNDIDNNDTKNSDDDQLTTEKSDIDIHQILLERARQNSQARVLRPQVKNDSDNLPAFRRLMNQGIKYLQNNQISEAENSFTTAQRLAPQSSAVYFYLSQIALKKVQPKKAEAIARRGLSVANNEDRRQALWQLILKSGILQNKAPIIEEAKKALNID